MDFTEKLFVDFLKKLIAFDKDSRSTIEVASRVVKDRYDGEKMNGVEFVPVLNRKLKVMHRRLTPLLLIFKTGRWGALA